MTSFFTPRTSDGKLFEEECILIAIWVSWLSGCPAIANQHSLRLRKAIGKSESTACRKALLTRNWENAFHSGLRALLSYAEFQSRHPGVFSAEHQARLKKQNFNQREEKSAAADVVMVAQPLVAIPPIALPFKPCTTDLMGASQLTPFSAEHRELIATWVCWLNNNAALANFHAMQLRILCGEKIGRRFGKAVLERDWDQVFDPRVQATLHYAEALIRNPKNVDQSHRDRMTDLGISDKDIYAVNQTVGYFHYSCISPKGFGARLRQARSSTSSRRHRSQRTLHQTAYRPIMRTMHTRFEGLGSDAASPWFDVFFRISSGMALGCGLGSWMIHGSKLTYMLGGQLPNHALINGLALGALVSLPINLLFFLFHNIRTRMAFKAKRPMPTMPKYVGRISLVLTLFIVFLNRVG